MGIVALVSCVKTKRSVPGQAKELYVSPLFRLMRRYAEKHSDQWFILSAKYGLIRPDQVIDPYEQTLKQMTRVARGEWAERVFGQMRAAGLLEVGNTFLWLAGNGYRQDLSLLLADFAQQNPLAGMSIGQRLSWLKRQDARPI